jgi:hypothetical protein
MSNRTVAIPFQQAIPPQPVAGYAGTTIDRQCRRLDRDEAGWDGATMWSRRNRNREGRAMRNVAICAAIAITLVGAIIVTGFQENVVLLWAAVTTIVATSIGK